MTTPVDADQRTLLAARNVAKSYGRRAVVSDASLELRSGEVVALLGPNGSGKTTLMSMLVGLVEPGSGRIEGDPRAAGWVPQGTATYTRLTVAENLRLFAALLDLPGDKDEIARTTAERAALMPWFDTPGWQLSGGLRQRLNIAVGMLGDPGVLVLDEPTTAVDLFHRHEMWHVLRQRANAGRAVLYSTHSLEDASFADRICMIVAGRIVYDGTLDGLARHEPSGRYPHVTDPVARGMLEFWGDADPAYREARS